MERLSMKQHCAAVGLSEEKIGLQRSLMHGCGRTLQVKEEGKTKAGTS